MTNTELDATGLDELVDDLKERIRNDGWMADTKSSMKEDLNRDRDYKRPGELVTRFEESWEETVHWEQNYLHQVFDHLEENNPDADAGLVWAGTREAMRELWSAYHNEHNTYQIAEELLERDNNDEEE